MKNCKICLALIGFFLLLSCKKSDYLSVKPDESLFVPKSLKDFQAILDSYEIMNGASGSGNVPAIGEAAADNYYPTTEYVQYIDNSYKNLFIWNDDIDGMWKTQHDWRFPYRTVFYANVVLDGITELDPAIDMTAYNNVKGSALFFRAHMFYQLAQIFAPLFDNATAEKDYGILLKIHADINEKISRATVKETYDKIITDLKEAALLLPEIPVIKTRPSKPAVNALLARVYLSMSDYENALKHSAESLLSMNSLMDYNSVNLSSSSRSPFVRHNTEVIFDGVLVPYNYMAPYIARVDSTLYDSYDVNDLRKSLFFGDSRLVGPPGEHFFRGSYAGPSSGLYFGGIAVDEMYLTRAECYARLNNKEAALSDLNALIIKRWNDTVPYVPITAPNATDALKKILVERRKELIFRGLRWMDLRRLNKEGENITLKRVFEGQTYTLPPNSAKYTFLIPPDVMLFNPNIPQNKR